LVLGNHTGTCFLGYRWCHWNFSLM
jgi:hypothetical protein